VDDARAFNPAQELNQCLGNARLGIFLDQSRQTQGAEGKDQDQVLNPLRHTEPMVLFFCVCHGLFLLRLFFRGFRGLWNIRGYRSFLGL